MDPLIKRLVVYFLGILAFLRPTDDFQDLVPAPHALVDRLTRAHREAANSALSTLQSSVAAGVESVQGDVGELHTGQPSMVGKIRQKTNDPH